jgi:hypothetical protein
LIPNTLPRIYEFPSLSPSSYMTTSKICQTKHAYSNFTSSPQNLDAFGTLFNVPEFSNSSPVSFHPHIRRFSQVATKPFTLSSLRRPILPLSNSPSSLAAVSKNSIYHLQLSDRKRKSAENKQLRKQSSASSTNEGSIRKDSSESLALYNAVDII